MEEKKKIKISLGTAICIFIIVILIVALFGMYYYNSKDISQNNNNNNNIVIKEQNKNIVNENNTLTNITDIKTNENTIEELESNKEETIKQVNYLEDYKKYVKDFASSLNSDVKVKNTTVDIDNDGTYELMIKSGTCEADMKMDFYTYKNGEIISLGSIGCGNTAFYKMNNENYLLAVYGHMGYEETYEINIYNNQIQKNKISSRQILIEEGYTEGDILLKDIINE